jgi:hypothetical protein
VEHVGFLFVNVDVAKSGGTEVAAHGLSILARVAYIVGIVKNALRKGMP